MAGSRPDPFAYPSSFFPDVAVFAPAVARSEARGDVAIADGAPGGLTLPCYAERGTAPSAALDRDQVARESRTPWSVFTAVDPQAALDSFVDVLGMRLQVVARARLSGGAWWTECVRVT